MENQSLPQPSQAPVQNNTPGYLAPKPARSKVRLIFKTIIIFFSVLVLVGAGYIVYLVTAASNQCSNTVPQQVHAEEQRQIAAMNKLVIVSGQKTHATASGNTDCIDGGVSSVSTNANFTVNTASYASLRDQIAANLARQGYQPHNPIQATGDKGDIVVGSSVVSSFNKLAQAYKDNRNHTLNLIFSFSQSYPYICPNNAKICADPNLQGIENAPVSAVSVDNDESN